VWAPTSCPAYNPAHVASAAREGHLHRSQYRRAQGTTLSVEPGAASRYLYYGRIRLDAGDASVSFSTNQLETGLVCLKGSANVTANGDTFSLGRFDSLYVPRGASVAVTPGAEGCDLAEVAAPVERQYPTKLVRFADVQKNAELRFNAGKDTNQREVNILIGKNVDTGRIMAGVTFSAPGNWTSWPPHEHAAMLEEAYLYIDMPAPGFGLQLVYTDTHEPEIATIVREGDVVLMPRDITRTSRRPEGRSTFSG
jgi:5-deoxy-glucuronate isomerase